MPKTITKPWNPAEHLNTEEDMAAYLEAALEEGDSALVAAALGDVGKANDGPMNSPKCPSCQERMSFAEFDLDGVWSCIYCEGTWLSASEVRALLARANVSGATPQARPVSVRAAGSLVCPACEMESLAEVEVGDNKAHCCTSCQSMFLGKGVLLNLCPTVAAGASGPEVAGRALANAVGWLVLSMVPISAP